MNKQMSREDILDIMLADASVRRSIVKRSHYWFFLYYLSEYIQYETAPFQREMFALTENTEIQNVVVAAFRGSAKSTIITLSFPIWAIVGEKRLKNVLILSRTEKKAQTFLQHIKYQLEQNGRLKKDLGPFQEERNGWNLYSLYLKNYNARITIGSTEQSLRGFRHNQYRPQLIICDDIEDVDSVRTQENRDKIFEWIVREVIPVGDKHTRLYAVGSVLHPDAPLMRLRKNIETRAMHGVYRHYPIVDAKGKPLWPGKFPDQAAIDAEKARGIPEITWRQEYLLEIIPEGTQIVKPEWIKFYKALPNEGYRFSATAIDPALKQHEQADYTAMVSFAVCGYDRNMKIYVLPNPINERLNPDQIVERANAISRALGKGVPTPVYVEDVGFQSVITMLLRKTGIPAESVPIHGQEKEARLLACSAYIQYGYIVFPETGAEKLLGAIFGFGTESHDDLVDAFTLGVLKITDANKSVNGFYEYIKQEIAAAQANPLSPGGLAGWKNLADRAKRFI